MAVIMNRLVSQSVITSTKTFFLDKLLKLISPTSISFGFPYVFGDRSAGLLYLHSLCLYIHIQAKFGLCQNTLILQHWYRKTIGNLMFKQASTWRAGAPWPEWTKMSPKMTKTNTTWRALIRSMGVQFISRSLTLLSRQVKQAYKNKALESVKRSVEWISFVCLWVIDKLSLDEPVLVMAWNRLVKFFFFK